MKTQEQIKSEIISYLTKTSNHVFIVPKKTWSTKEEKYIYDYKSYKLFKVVKIGDDFYTIIKNPILIIDVKEKIDIDYYIKYYNNNAKNVIKHQLFLDKGMKSVKRKKFDFDIK